MNKYSFKQKFIAALLGAYIGSLIANGLGELVGVSWNNTNGGVWWKWIVASLVISTTISFPLALIFFYTLVPIVCKLIGVNNESSLKKYVIVGAISASIPVIFGYSIHLGYVVYCCAPISNFAGSILVFLLLLFHAISVGVACLVVLYKRSYKKSFKRDFANRAAT